MKSTLSTLIAALLVTGSTVHVRAQATSTPQDLTRVSIEDLMKIEITSAAKKEQRADEVPAAVSVITQEDIRRSGIRTLPELFRLVPGVQVAQLTSSNWAVSIRGFNDQYSNKLLVLIDGRSIYQRVFSGVFWDAEDLVLDDIDRIEVIRGPGAAVWGANAVNGVINIVTKSAKDSQGTLVRLSGGAFDRAQATARYGGSFRRGAYRVYSQWTARGDTKLADGTPDDKWNVLTNGVRVDWARGANEWTMDGSVRTGDGHTTWKFPGVSVPDVAPRTDVESSFRTGNVLGRWTHREDNGSSLQVQSTVGILRRIDFATSDENNFDAEVQYHRKLGRRQDVVTGGGYRFVKSTTGTNFSVSFDPPSLETVVTNVFVQDEVALTDRLRLTLGTKLEHETFSGWGLQPNVRLMWTPANRQHIWMGASRALRTPSLADLVLRLNAVVVPGEPVPIIIGALGNPQYRAEELLEAEAGYRLEIGSAVFFDVTAFRGHYNGLPTSEPLAPVFETTPGPPHVFLASRLQNLLQADTTGVEIAAHVSPVPGWRVDASYSTFHLTPHPDASSMDPAAATFDGNAPDHQWQVHSSVALGPRTEVDGTLFHTGAITSLVVPAYTRADVRVEVRLTGRLSAVAAGRNLFDSTHAEYTSNVLVATRVPRSANVSLTWKF
jgi:iron complex outermembrane receptor protein